MAYYKIPSAQTLVKMFIQHIYLLHEAPERIISERGVQFTSSFWQEFLKMLGTSQGLSSSTATPRPMEAVKELRMY